MDNNIKLINCNLLEFCEPFCAIIENAQSFEQEIKDLCVKVKVDLFGNKGIKLTSVLINELKQKLELDENKVKLAKQIIDARNQLVHSFFLNPSECMSNIKIDNIEISKNFLDNFCIINKLIFEVRDFFANLYDNGNRPNFVDGTYNPL